VFKLFFKWGILSFAILILIPYANGQTWFSEEAEPYGVNLNLGAMRTTHSCSWADYDNDGDEDLLFTYYD
jgi:hypothetical protein